MNNLKIISSIVLATVLIFGAGVFTGGLLVNGIQKSHPKPTRKTVSTPEVHPLVTTNEPAKPRPPEILSKRFLQQLDGELSLKPNQREAVEKIIEDGQNLMRKAVQDARLEIREVLTPEQRVMFDELVKRPFHRSIFNTNSVPVVKTNSP